MQRTHGVNNTLTIFTPVLPQAGLFDHRAGLQPEHPPFTAISGPHGEKPVVEMTPVPLEHDISLEVVKDHPDIAMDPYGLVAAADHLVGGRARAKSSDIAFLRFQLAGGMHISQIVVKQVLEGIGIAGQHGRVPAFFQFPESRNIGF